MNVESVTPKSQNPHWRSVSKLLVNEHHGSWISWPDDKLGGSVLKQFACELPWYINGNLQYCRVPFVVPP